MSACTAMTTYYIPTMMVRSVYGDVQNAMKPWTYTGRNIITARLRRKEAKGLRKIISR
jgi:hypothetical protein